MENSIRTDLNRVSRKAEETALRRYQAAHWLEYLVGPLNISSQPTEREFISCLRNGLILCNAINKIHPGAVPKVVEINSHTPSVTWESQPLPAYQYFENVRNFLVAVEEMKLPAFEASDLERETLEVGSAAKVVDCILALKSYNEWQQMNGGNGFYKHTRSPSVMQSAVKIHSQASSDTCRQLDMSVSMEKQSPADRESQILEDDSILKVLAEYMVGSKENMDENLLVAFRNGNLDSAKIFRKIISSFFEGQLQNKLPELKSRSKDNIKESSDLPAHVTPTPLTDISQHGSSQQCCKACLRKGNCSHRNLFQMQQKELSDLKVLLSRTKMEFEGLQSQFKRDVKELESQVQEMSTAALGYYRVVKENRNLYNMVQDLKGNIRVYCRIRPAFSAETRNVIDFIGDDGSLVIQDPLKVHKDGRKVFQFNRVFGPSATQGDVYEDTLPLIRSVMDGYNVCIFAYGQTGSGKTYTMSGPSGGSTKDMGINYLALNDLFQLSHRRKDIVTYDIHVQMVEIYNEQVRDLLSHDASNTKLEIRSCNSENGLSLPDAIMHPVKSTADVLNLMKLGEMNRVVSSTALNDRSSRSHSVLTVHVHGKDATGSTLRSCLHLVDLAGSERVDKSEVTGDRLKEAQHINKSLSCLGDVITALAQKNSHIPYRNSKLTLLLQDSLGGHAKTLMFAHVSPEGDSFGETMSTLKFAQRVSTVELGAARSNKESSEVLQLKEQIESLRKALANKKAQGPRIMMDQTPPRSRRLSVENNSTTKTKAPVTERTPPRGRRLSIENGSSTAKTKDPRSPREKPKAMTERTPPRTRRLSIENGSTVKTEKATNAEERKGPKTPSVPPRARRLSLEGQRYGKKDNILVKAPDDATKPLLPIEAVSIPKGQYQDAEATFKLHGNFGNGSSGVEVYHIEAPRSPTSSSFQKLATKTQIPGLSAKTPEPQIIARNEVQILTESEIALSTDSRTTNGKGSQIRRSLRTIGKLINGTEKRDKQSSKEARSPPRSMKTNDDLKSPLTANARALRRQSLTGNQTLGSDRSRRSSLGGKPIDSSINDSRNASNRNAKTPPPAHPSTKTTKRWL